MPRIRCHYTDCDFWDDRYCSAAAVEINPEAGCLTYRPNEDAQAANWEDDVELDDWDTMGSDEDPIDLWADEDMDDDTDEEDPDEY